MFIINMSMEGQFYIFYPFYYFPCFQRTMNLFVCLNKPTEMFVTLVLRSRLDHGCADKYQCVNSFRGKLFFDVKEESFGTKKKEYSPPPNEYPI